MKPPRVLELSSIIFLVFHQNPIIFLTCLLFEGREKAGLKNGVGTIKKRPTQIELRDFRDVTNYFDLFYDH